MNKLLNLALFADQGGGDGEG
jgi:uncharacterized membrane protein